MGPFTLMDYIGNDINYTVTETVFKAFYYDPRYKPSFTQKRMAEAGYLGRKSGRGYYDYSEGAAKAAPTEDTELGQQILWRILVMLINEAADALYLRVASRDDIDMAMTKAVTISQRSREMCDALGQLKVELSVSWGVADCAPNLDPEEVLSNADKQMFSCKAMPAVKAMTLKTA